ncbi:MAG TPA: hypothetical protein VH277_07025 [Gemmatimonadaceae bacterium]|nr:hypothetical protein [Gemmatimonadaceae bacterium]
MTMKRADVAVNANALTGDTMRNSMSDTVRDSVRDVRDSVRDVRDTSRDIALRPTPVADMVMDPKPRWLDGQSPFLTQPRAYSALRHELDEVVDVLKAYAEGRRETQADYTFDVYVLPHRVIARLDDHALSVSWVAGRVATVDHGRLLVIEWTGVALDTKGMAALKSATPRRERVYRVEGAGPDQWRWRRDESTDGAYTTSELIAEWIASVTAGARA